MTHKKLPLILFLVVALVGILFFFQIKKAREITVQKNPVALISPTATYIPIADTDLILGNPGAAITVVEFGDLNCKNCMQLHREIQSIVEAHPQDIRLIWKDDPQPKLLLRNSTLNHRAAWCAGQESEKKFWEFLAASEASGGASSEQAVQKIGAALGLDANSWWQCAQSNVAQQKILDSIQLAENLNITSVPAIFVNNKRINTDAEVNIKDMLEGFIKK
jgi:protein-disulfide isomerase